MSFSRRYYKLLGNHLLPKFLIWKEIYYLMRLYYPKYKKIVQEKYMTNEHDKNIQNKNKVNTLFILTHVNYIKFYIVYFSFYFGNITQQTKASAHVLSRYNKYTEKKIKITKPSKFCAFVDSLKEKIKIFKTRHRFLDIFSTKQYFSYLTHAKKTPYKLFFINKALLNYNKYRKLQNENALLINKEISRIFGFYIFTLRSHRLWQNKICLKSSILIRCRLDFAILSRIVKKSNNSDLLLYGAQLTNMIQHLAQSVKKKIIYFTYNNKENSLTPILYSNYVRILQNFTKTKKICFLEQESLAILALPTSGSGYFNVVQKYDVYIDNIE